MSSFLGVGIPEILLVLILALIVVGPKRLPEAAAQIGRTVGQLRRYANEFRREFMSEFEDVRSEWEASQQEATEIRRQLSEAEASVKAETRHLDQDVARAVGDVNAALATPIESTARVLPDETEGKVIDIEAAAQRRQHDDQSPGKDGGADASPTLRRH